MNILTAGNQAAKTEGFVRILYEAATGKDGSHLPVVLCRAMLTNTDVSGKDTFIDASGQNRDIWHFNKGAIADLTKSPTWADALTELKVLKQQHGCSPTQSESEKFACILTAVWSMKCVPGIVDYAGKNPY